MNEKKHDNARNMSLDDPRLTAYALGELDDAECKEIESRLANWPEGAREVEAIRRVAGLLETEMQAEPAAELTDTQRTAIERQAERAKTAGRANRSAARRVLRLWWSPAGVAASILLLAVAGLWLWPSSRKVYEATTASGERPRSDVDRLMSQPAGNVRGYIPPGEDHSARATALVGGDSPERAGREDGLGDVETDALAQGFQYTVEFLEQETSEIPPPQLLKYPSNWLDVVNGSQQAASARARPQLSPEEARKLASLGYITSLPPDVNNEIRIVIPPDPGMAEGRISGTEAYDRIVENPFRNVTQNPLSTFSIDVDTASYSNMRRFLMQGTMPPPDSVRIEELINYFSYDYPQPDDKHPFSVNVEVADCPWAPTHLLAKIGLKGYEIAADERPSSNLVFLIDVSGSMQPPNKLPLLKQAMKSLVDQLDEYDRVAIVVYAGASGLVLPSTSCKDRGPVLAALDDLRSGGSTNGGAGIQLAYDVAAENFIEGGVNRVILATDGDFNVGVTNQGDLTRLIEDRAKEGVFLTVLGFGMGNYKDSTLEKLADQGNGNYAYIDSLTEVRKVLVEQMGGTLVTIAKDVKIQIEFNPALAAAYRLIGYENRILAAEDFNDDTKDAGEIGAGHTVTALYEIIPAGEQTDVPPVDPLKYQSASKPTGSSDELMTVKLRYKPYDGDVSNLIERPVVDEGLTMNQASADFHFAAAVASFGMLLRNSRYAGTSTYDMVQDLAESGLGAEDTYRLEFLDLVKRAAATAAQQ
jgi:Ca-activated chloride channel family protein